jgi:hypothetical protein
MQAVDESTSKKITVTPVDVPESQKPQFQPTSNQGVSFPSDEKTPTITVNFGKPAEVNSITIPHDKIYGANVQQFEVTFYSTNGSKVNQTPIKSTSSLPNERNKPAHLGFGQIPSDTPVSRVEIKIISTTDNQSPKGVVLDIKACTEATPGNYYGYFLKCDVPLSIYLRHNWNHIVDQCFEHGNRSNWYIRCNHAPHNFRWCNKCIFRNYIDYRCGNGNNYKGLRRNASC